MSADIAKRARFDRIRYAQVWEDADILVQALRVKPTDTVVSIGSAGDNCLALLAEGPERVIAVDLNPAQLACIRFRKAALSVLTHDQYLELMGSRLSDRRDVLLTRVVAQLDETDQRFWRKRKSAIIRNGLGGVGKFESYFRLFRRSVLPFAHSRRDVKELLAQRPASARASFYDTHWNTPAWSLLVNTFFSRPVMGGLGRDPAFFDHVEGGAAAHVAEKCRRAAIEQDPSENPYLHWILTGRHGGVLPRPLSEQCFERARTRLERLELFQGSIDALADSGVRADAFNLSDIFEYMSPDAHAQSYARILSMARPDARLAYWNMMAPRRAPAAFAGKVRTRSDLEAALKPQDKAFFYRDFVVEEALA